MEQYTRIVLLLLLALVKVSVAQSDNSTNTTDTPPVPEPESLSLDSSISLEEEIDDYEIMASQQMRFAFVMFRHGGAFADPDLMHEYQFWPMEAFETLTSEGKSYSLEMGKIFRERYFKTLSNSYLREEAVIRSINENLPKAALFWFLAGLYYPNSTTQMFSNFEWQPVPYDALQTDVDDLMYYENCMKYKLLKNKTVQLDSIQKILLPMQGIMDFVANKTNNTVNSVGQYSTMSYLLDATTHGGSIPPWLSSERVRYEDIHMITHIDFLIRFHTPEMVRLASGVMMKELHDIMKTVRSGAKTKRLYLLSANQYSMAAVMSASQVLATPHQPKLGSFFLLEVQYVPYYRDYSIQALYKANEEGNMTYLPIKGCDQKKICWLKTFFKVTKHLLMNYKEYKKACSQFSIH